MRISDWSSDVCSSDVQLGLGVKVAAIYRTPGQGNIMQTENPLDLAINGRGFLMVEMPSGETAYTRAGSLQLSPDGDIVTADGYIVQPGITVPTDAVSISVNESGEVYVDLDGQVAPVRVGQLELAN